MLFQAILSNDITRANKLLAVLKSKPLLNKKSIKDIWKRSMKYIIISILKLLTIQSFVK